MQQNKVNRMLYTIDDIKRIFTNSEMFLSKRLIGVTNVSIDSREVKRNGMFFALSGHARDGHAFIRNAVQSGATVIIAEYIPNDVKNTIEYEDISIIIVKNSLEALVQVAKYNRDRIKAKVIGITGNIGKTTTKETMNTVLGKFFKTYCSPKSYNNHIGLPFTLANTSLETEVLILELGMNHKGEIKHLVDIARPDIAIITTIAPVHTEYFDSIEDIVRAKAEIFTGVNQNGIVILNKENIYFGMLEELAKKEGIKNIFTIGSEDSNMYIKSHSFTKFFSTKYDVCFKTKTQEEITPAETAGISYHNAFNTLFTFAVSKLFRLDLAKVSEIVNTITIVEGRGNIESISTEGKNIVIINDAYNSSPEALKAAIKSLAVHGSQRPESRTVAIVGDMLELGSKSEEYHLDILKDLIRYKVQFVITVGQFMKLVHDGLPEGVEKIHFDETRFLVKTVRKFILDKDIILFKASRGMKFEVVIDKLYR